MTFIRATWKMGKQYTHFAQQMTDLLDIYQ